MSTLDSFKAAVATAVITFVTLFGASVQGWVGEGTIPDYSTAKAAATSAGLAAAAGLVNFVVRWAQGRIGLGQVPVYVKATKESPT